MIFDIITITFITSSLFKFESIYAKSILRTNVFQENEDNLNDIAGGMQDFNEDSFDNFESHLMDGDNPGLLAVVVMDNKPAKTLRNSKKELSFRDHSEDLTRDDKVINYNNTPLDLKMGEDDSDSGENSPNDRISEDYLDDTGNSENSLRKALRGCNKKSFKRCKKACEKAFKVTCSEYQCSRRKKKALNKGCKTSCKANFS